MDYRVLGGIGHPYLLHQGIPSGLKKQGGLHHHNLGAIGLKGLDPLLDHTGHQWVHDAVQPGQLLRVREYDSAQAAPVNLAAGLQDALAEGFHHPLPGLCMGRVGFMAHHVGINKRGSQRNHVPGGLALARADAAGQPND